MKYLTIIAVVLCSTVPAEAQLLRRVFGGGRQDCGPGGCAVAPVQFVQPEFVQAPRAVEEPRQFEAWQLGGVDRDKVNGDKEHYNLCGKEVSKRDGYQAIGSALDDDSGKYWLVLTGDGADKAAEAFKEKLPDLAGKTRVQQYAAGHFFAPKFQAGSPGVTFMRPNREVMYESDRFDVESLRRADPDYKPSPRQAVPFVLILAGMVAFLIWRH